MLHLSSFLQDISRYLLPCVASTAATEGEWEQSKQQGSPLAAFAYYGTWRLLVLLAVLCMPEDMQCVCTYAVKFALGLWVDSLYCWCL